jgi:hypothetical protein
LLILNQLIILKILPVTIFKELVAAYTRKQPETIPKDSWDSENCSERTGTELIEIFMEEILIPDPAP